MGRKKDSRNALEMMAAGLGGEVLKRPERVTPEGWITHQGMIDINSETELGLEYDKGIETIKVLKDLPEEIRNDPFVQIMLQQGYSVHEFSTNTICQETEEHQKEAKNSPQFDIYLIGYDHPKFDGEDVLKKLFRKLGGFDEDNKKLPEHVIDSNFKLAVQSVVGESNIAFSGESHGIVVDQVIDQIKGYCHRRSAERLIGHENPDIIRRTCELVVYLHELTNEIIRYKEMGSKGTSERHKLSKLHEWAAVEFFRLSHERSRNVYIPLMDSFLATKKDDEKLIGIYSPDYFRKPTFMGGYQPGTFNEKGYNGGLREVCAKHGANYITFMRPSSQTR